MSIDLSFDDTQRSIATALFQFCDEHASAGIESVGTREFPHALWRRFAGLGVLGAATPEGEAGPREIVAAMETLGYAAFPGPLAGSFLATQLVPAEERVAIAEGRAIAAVGSASIFPFGPIADLFLELEGESIYRVRPLDRVEPVGSLGGEPWGRVQSERVEQFDDVARALALYRTALAAYLVGAGDALIRGAASHAATRKQFGQPIGQFQAVAHPLADCHIRLEAARLLARSAADQLDRGESGFALEASAAHFSARRAAIEAAHTAHQVFGAVGITLAGPVYRHSRRIMQTAGLPPGADSDSEALYAGNHALRQSGKRCA